MEVRQACNWRYHGEQVRKSYQIVTPSCHLLRVSADVLQFLTKGYVKSTIRKTLSTHAKCFLAHGTHRSCRGPSARSGTPPSAGTRQSYSLRFNFALNKSQLYFVRPSDDTPIIPVPSPVLERAGLLTEEDKKADPKSAVRGYGACSRAHLPSIAYLLPFSQSKTGPELASRCVLCPQTRRRFLIITG